MKLPERAVSVIAKIEEFLCGSSPLPRSAYDLFLVSAPVLNRAFEKFVLAGKYGVWRSWEEFCDWFVLSYGAAVVRTGGYDARRYRFSVRWICEKVSDLMADLEDKKNAKTKKHSPVKGFRFAR